MARIIVLLLSLFLVFSFVTFIRADRNDNNDDDENNCVYAIYVKSGLNRRVNKAVVVSLQLANVYDETVKIDDLVTWGGLMGPNYDYFQRGKLDVFSGKAKCLVAPACAMNLTFGIGRPRPGRTEWFCDYVQVTSTEPKYPCAQQLFKVGQSLSPGPDPLSVSVTITRDNCFPTPGFAGNSGRLKPGSDALSYVA